MRITSRTLIVKWTSIVKLAKLDESEVPRTIDTSIKAALLEHENYAVDDEVRAAKVALIDKKNGYFKSNTAMQPGLAIPTEHRRPSKRIGKSKKMAEVARGKTALRAEILEQELEVPSVANPAFQNLNPFRPTDGGLSESPIEVEGEATLGALQTRNAHMPNTIATNTYHPYRQSTHASVPSSNPPSGETWMSPPSNSNTVPNHWVSSTAQHVTDMEIAPDSSIAPSIAVRSATLDNQQGIQSLSESGAPYNYLPSLEHGPKSPINNHHTIVQQATYPPFPLSRPPNFPSQGLSHHTYDEPMKIYSAFPEPDSPSQPAIFSVLPSPTSRPPTSAPPETSSGPVSYQSKLHAVETPATPIRTQITTPPLQASPPPLSASHLMSSAGKEVSRGIPSDENLTEVSAPKRVSTNKSGKVPIVETSDGYWPEGWMPDSVRKLDVYKTRQKLEETWPTGMKLMLAKSFRYVKKDSRLGLFIQDRDIVSLSAFS